MGRLTLAGAVLMALVVAPASSLASGHHSRPVSCVPRGYQVLLSDAHAEIYSAKAAPGAFGCMRRSGKHTSFRLAGLEPGSASLAGTVVAWSDTLPSTSCCSSDIVSLSLRTGHVLHRVSIAPTEQRVILEQAQALQVLVKDDGAVAWVQEDSYGTHDGAPLPPTTFTIYAVDNTGFHQLSPEIDWVEPEDLQLAGSVLSWTRSGTTESGLVD